MLYVNARQPILSWALYGQINADGKLELVNHLGIDGLGDTPEEILTNIEQGNIDPAQIKQDVGMASDMEYAEWIRDIESDIPARFNADQRRLFEASGCAEKAGRLCRTYRHLLKSQRKNKFST